MITLKCKLEPDDYLKAQRLHLRSTRWLKYLGLAFLSFCFVIVVAAGSLTKAFEILFMLVFLGLFYALIYFVIQPWNIRRVFAQQKTLQIEYETVISPDTIKTTSKNGHMEMPLADFHRYTVGKDLILLYQSQALFHMFPRRFFSSEDEFKTFISYLEENLGNAKR